MIDHYDLLPAVRQDLDLLLGDLITVSGQLEELATMWRRQCQAGNSWPDMPHAFPQGLRDAADQLAGTLRALAGAGPGQAPDLASSAAAQLAALDAGIAAAVTGCADGGAQQGAAAIRATMRRAATRQQSLLAHLVKTGG
jgi:hypothetical protein